MKPSYLRSVSRYGWHPDLDYDGYRHPTTGHVITPDHAGWALLLPTPWSGRSCGQ